MGFLYCLASLIVLLTSCNSSKSNVLKAEAPFVKAKGDSTQTKEIYYPQGKTLIERFSTPEHFERVHLDTSSFGYYLRNLSVKPDSTNVHYYNGKIKSNRVWAAIINMDIGNSDLQQCADAVMRLRSEYLWYINKKDKIHFNFTNGFLVEYAKWKAGYRVKIKGNTTSWYQATGIDTTYKTFRKYMDLVFTYAGTLSLSRELKSIPLDEIQPGDVFIHGGSPGHAVIVVDMAQTENGNEKIFMIAQSYMPAQDIHILKNFNNLDISPWYKLSEIKDKFYTPEWTFDSNELMRFND